MAVMLKDRRFTFIKDQHTKTYPFSTQWLHWIIYFTYVKINWSDNRSEILLCNYLAVKPNIVLLFKESQWELIFDFRYMLLEGGPQYVLVRTGCSS